jgi:hypothetical protein
MVGQHGRFRIRAANGLKNSKDQPKGAVPLVCHSLCGFQRCTVRSIALAGFDALGDVGKVLVDVLRERGADFG